MRANGDGAGGGHVDHLHRPRAHVAHELGEPRDVVDVLQDLAHRLEHHRELLEPARDAEQLGGLLALLPQRGAAGRVAPGQQQRAGRALAEPRGEQRGVADLGRDHLLDLVRVEQHVLGGRHDLLAGVVEGLGQPQDDAVVRAPRRTSRPRVSRNRAAIASAHGALTCAPKGECTTSRQSPSSSRKRSTTMVRSLGTWRVDSLCSRR